MKKLFLLLTVFALIFSSCDDESTGKPDNGKTDNGGTDNGKTDKTDNSDVIGTWTGPYGNTGEITLEINDGTFVVVFRPSGGTISSHDGTWTRNGNTLIFKYASGFTSTYDRASLSGDKLLFTYSRSNYSSNSTTYELTKKGSSTDTPSPKTSLTINNLSDFNLLSVEYSGVDFGTINSGKDVTKEVSDGTKYIFFSLASNNGNVRCRTDAYNCEEDKENEFSITNNTVVTTTIDEKRDSLKNIFDELNKKTALRIKNESFTEITDVIWQNTRFSNTQYDNSIKTGTSVTENVKPGAGYIFFKRKSNPITARTRDMVAVGQDTDVEFTFNDNTPIVEANNPNNTGTLGSLQGTVVWWDDAEGEMQPYYLKQSEVDYYLSSGTGYSGGYYIYYHSPKNGRKSIRIGGTNTAKLHLKINLDKKAKLSFWYANKYYDTNGTTFSINGEQKAKWITDINWSQATYELEPGENNLIWEKKDGYVNRYVVSGSGFYNFYYYLSLDDILIYYTE